MINLDWDAVQRIVSPYADIPINEMGDWLPSGNRMLFLVTEPDGYSVVPAKFRPVSDSLSQADGSSIQPIFIDGMVASLTVQFWVCPNGNRESATAACDADLEAMRGLLMGALNSLRQEPQDVTGQQYRWRPPDASVDRVLNGVMLAAWPVPDFTNNPAIAAKIAVGGPYPYAVDDDPETVSIASGDSATVTNGGNSDTDLIVRAYGPLTEFVVSNLTYGPLVSYDSSRPGAAAIESGHYAEIDFFAGTILLDGDPGDDLIAGLDPSSTDLFPLHPGSTEISAAGADIIDVISWASWV